MPKSKLEDVAAEIENLRARLNELERNKAGLETLAQTIEKQRPAGIPATWKALYDLVGNNVKINAWFDPAKYGEDFGNGCNLPNLQPN